MVFDPLESVSAESLFSTANNQAAQMESLANQSLSNGIEKYTNEDYKGAAEEFKRAFGLSPYSSYAIDTIKYAAMSYQKAGDTQKAIQIYKQGIQIHSDSDELQFALGNIYFAEEEYGKALESYEAAVHNYDDGNNRFALGQAYLKVGRLDDAANQFEKVIKMAPDGTSGYFGLGQVYAAQKKYSDAVDQFERAFEKDDEFYDAFAEIGYTYADAGEIDKAKLILADLDDMDEDLAGTLESYINKQTTPQMLFAWASSSFHYYLPAKTPVAALNDYLANANSSTEMMIQLQFSKEMNTDSVENPVNWSIKRSKESGPGMRYNNGLAVPATEATASMLPTNVFYDPTTFTATVSFSISQNADTNATIDPNHIVFQFNGKDADGNNMDPEYDQFMGFSGHF